MNFLIYLKKLNEKQQIVSNKGSKQTIVMIFKSNLKERIKKPNCSLKEISEKGLRAN